MEVNILICFPSFRIWALSCFIGIINYIMTVHVIKKILKGLPFRFKYWIQKFFYGKVPRHCLKNLERSLRWVDCQLETKQCRTLSRFKPVQLPFSSLLSEFDFAFSTISWHLKLCQTTQLCFRHVLKSLTDSLFAHTVYRLNNITLKQHWAIIFIKGKLETSEAYIFAVFTGKRNVLFAFFS